MATQGGLKLQPTSEFKRDAKRLRKRGKDMERLRAVVEALRLQAALEPRHRDHALTGNLKGWRDCHIEPDWVLIYRIVEDNNELILGRTGTHSDLFG